MEQLAREKANLRRFMKQKLKSMTEQEKRQWDQAVCEQVFSLPEMLQRERIYAYMSLPWETGTELILKRLWAQGTRTALPKVMGETMEFFEVCSMEDLKEGAFHILEPKEHCAQVCWPEAYILVPGLAFTPKGIRLGKGGGFYDRFLEKEPDHQTIALAYEFQIVEQIPADVYDRPVDRIVTDKRVL